MNNKCLHEKSYKSVKPLYSTLNYYFKLYDYVLIGKPYGMYDFYPEQYNKVGLDDTISWIDFADQTLGNALGVAEGIALGSNKKIVVFISDAQLNMGNTLEAIISIGFKKLNNILLLVDYNNSGSKGLLSEVLKPNLNIFSNWNIIYNNNFEINYIEHNKPTVIIYNTEGNINAR